jgi:hypothetical protein
MKKFILQIIKYFSIIFIFFMSPVIISYFIISSADFNIPKNKTIVFIGDSHTECSINDKIFTQSFNISQSGAAYMYAYVKLKKFLAVNDTIEKVALSFHGRSIGKSLDDWTIGEEKMQTFVPTYISLLSINEINVLIKNRGFFSAIYKALKQSDEVIIKYIKNHYFTYNDLSLGGYLWLDRDKLQADIEMRNTNSVNPLDYSAYQLEFLLKIVELCERYNVELILFNSPTFKSEQYGNLDELSNYYNKHLKGIKYIDYSNFDLPEYGYGDIEHLNYKGAEIFSKYLEEHYQEIF